MVSFEERLRKAGIVLPVGSAPAANYVNCTLHGGLLFVSGKGPSGGVRGKLGLDYSTEEGYRFARVAGMEILAVVREAAGGLDHVKRVVKAQGFVNAAPEFAEHHKVMDGFSDLMAEIFGEIGRHARSVLGANSLRDQLPVIVESIFAIDTENREDLPHSADHFPF